MRTISEIEEKMVSLRVNELAIREQVIEQIDEIHKRELWKGLGYRNLGEFCEKHLGYQQEEVREILISMGEIITTDRLIAEDPKVQRRIEFLKAWGGKNEFEKRKHLRLLIFSNRTLLSIAHKNPKTREEFLGVNGLGEKKADLFGYELVSDLAKFDRASTV